MVSSHIMMSGLKICLVAAVGHTKSAITNWFVRLRNTISHSKHNLFAWSDRSLMENPRSLLIWVLTSSALNHTQPRLDASSLARLVLPDPGNPITNIFRLVIMTGFYLFKLTINVTLRYDRAVNG